MKDSITVPWPALPIGEPGWRTRLDSLAERSEALVGKSCRRERVCPASKLPMIHTVIPYLPTR